MATIDFGLLLKHQMQIRQRGPRSFAQTILLYPPWLQNRVVAAQILTVSAQSWGEYQQTLAHCQRCPSVVCLSRERVHFLPRRQEGGKVEVLFVLDAPSCDFPQGRIYPDSWGELLEKMIQSMNLTSYHITLAIKCVVPEQTTTEMPTIKEQMGNNCLAHLQREILQLRPAVVATFGAAATNLLLAKKEKLANIHGQMFDYPVEGGDGSFTTKLVPLFHPEFLLINPNMKRTTWPDLQKIMAYLQQGKGDP